MECMSSLCEGHANLYIFAIVVYVLLEQVQSKEILTQESPILSSVEKCEGPANICIVFMMSSEVLC